MLKMANVEALCRVMEKAYEAGEGARGRDLFAQALMSELKFSRAQADLYTSVVLSRNTNGSADRARTAAGMVMGRWSRASSEGANPSVYLRSSQDTWEFKDDLTYEHRRSSYEGYVAPPSPFFSFSYSRPSEHVDRGTWAPPDWWEETGLSIVILPLDGEGRRLTIQWTDPTSFFHSSCKIGGLAYARV
jgi:hypothetical protein